MNNYFTNNKHNNIAYCIRNLLPMKSFSGITTITMTASAAVFEGDSFDDDVCDVCDECDDDDDDCVCDYHQFRTSDEINHFHHQKENHMGMLLSKQNGNVGKYNTISMGDLQLTMRYWLMILKKALLCRHEFTIYFTAYQKRM